MAKIASHPLPLGVAIDIKPGGSPNSINPRSNGNIPVAVLTTLSFDASTVDPSTVRFGPFGAQTGESTLQDVDGDGRLDLVLNYHTDVTGIACGQSIAIVTGQTFAKQLFSRR